MPNQQEPLQKAIIIIFLVLVAANLIPRILNPTPPAAEPTKDSTSTTQDPSHSSHQNPSDITNDQRSRDHIGSSHSEPQYTRESTIPTGDNMGYKSSVNVMNVQYCSSGSYKKTYDQLEQMVQQKYPTLLVTGVEYPLDAFKALLSKAVTVAQYGLYALLFAGDMIFAKLGIQPPALYQRIAQKKMIVIFAVMFGIGQLKNALFSTGAFEVYLNNELVFSKLQTGHAPSLVELEGILAHYNV